MQKYFFLILLFIFSFGNIKSQSLLTLDKAKKITLANNFGIAVAKNNLDIAKNLTNKNANGYLPTVTATGNLNTNLGGSTQTFNSGNDVNTSSALTWGTNASIKAQYALVDKKRELTLEQLKKSVTLSDLQLKLAIEENLFQVYNAYYKVAQLTQNMEVLNRTIKISAEQLRRAESQEYYGQASKLKVLNAQVDIQRDRVNLLNEKTNLENAKRNLNALMGISSNQDFKVEVDSNSNKELSENELLRKAKNRNLNLLINRQNLTVEKMNLQLIDAEKRPTISAGVSYDFNFSDNPDEAFIVNSRAQGLAANVGVNWKIFDGSHDIKKQNALLKLSNQELQIRQLELQLERDIRNAFSNYQNAIFILKVEKDAVSTNLENFSQTEEQFRFGRQTSIEFRQAQLNLVNAQTSYNNAKFLVKTREMELLRLAGDYL